MLIVFSLMTGTVPTSVGRLSNLGKSSSGGAHFTRFSLHTYLSLFRQPTAFLEVSGNPISGSIPSELGMCTSLTGLYMNTNTLSGSVPTELGNLNLLKDISLAFNSYLSGSVPSEITSLSTLASLDIGGTSLTIDDPKKLCDREPSVAVTMHTDTFYAPKCFCCPST